MCVCACLCVCVCVCGERETRAGDDWPEMMQSCIH